MLNTLKLHLNQNKALIIATTVSLLFHALLLTKFKLIMPELDDGTKTLAIRLVNVKPAQKISSVVATDPIYKQNSLAKIEPLKNIEAPTEPSNLNDSNFNADAPVIPESHQAEAPSLAPSDTIISENSNLLVPESTSIASEEETSPIDIDKEPKPIIYQHVESEFDVTRGGDGTPAGMTRITLNIDKNGTYILTSISDAKGLASLFFSTLVQKSEGSVTETGLVPSYFSYQYGNDTTKSQSARFLWSAGILQMHSVKGDKTEKLDAGTQDFLSFMYQFMFTPPLENTQITMTNGKHLRTYTYSFEGEEFINTKLGMLKTTHLLTSSNEEEKTELWLAIDYQNLPVKMRKTEKDGAVIEQTISNIYTEAP